MFLRALILVILFTILCIKNFATEDSTYCGTDSYNAMTQIGGKYITSYGTLKVLFIMIDFCDDDEDRNNPVWPMGYPICDEEEEGSSSGPNFLNDIVDETETQNSGTIANATTFFNDMSKGLFKMIGKAYHVRAPHPLSWYIANHQGQEAAYSARDAIQILDQSVNFYDFDRWIDAPYIHNQGQDGVLDMVFICYRRWYDASSFFAEGWYYGSLPSGEVWVDNNQRRITGNHSVNVLNMYNYPKMDVVYHEYGHVWGLNHNYSPGLWSLMSRTYRVQTSFMNSFEREKLGWIAFHDISSSQTVSLRDFGEYPQDAYRFNIGTNEYFILENHQFNTPYDNPDLTGKKGLYIIRQFPYQSTPNEGNLKVETADGRFNWSNPEWVIFPGTNELQPVFIRNEVNRALGLNDRDHFTAISPSGGPPKIYFLLAKKDEVTGQNVYGAFYKGDGRDAFTLDFNNVFNTWSNPPTRLKSGALPSTNVGIEILPSSTSTLDIQFFIGNPQNASPSKPTLGWYHVGPVTYGWIHLGWGANLWDNNPVDPDINWSELQRKIGGGSWVTVYSGSNRTWSDHSITYDPNGNTPVYFRVRWRDSQNKWSVWSDLFNTKMINNYAEKASHQNYFLKPSEYNILQNYPNPFNPQTTIQYEIKEKGLVSLKVYDVLGKEVAELVNETKDEGRYSVMFDASELPSGIYIYSIRVNNFSSNQKMLLLK